MDQCKLKGGEKDLQTQRRIEALEMRLQCDYALNDNGGEIVIHELGDKIPLSAIGQLWTGIRKRIRKDYGVDVVGLPNFTEKGSMQLQLLLNVAVAENRAKNYISKAEKNGEKVSLSDKEVIKKTEMNKYLDTFRLSFFNWIVLVEEVLDCFLLDFTNGYEPYLDAIEKNAPDRELEAMIDRFLESINMRDRKVS